MRRRGKWARRIGRAAGTVTIGLLLGFLVPTMAQDMSPKPEVQATVAEAPLARQFINAFIADDTATLNALDPQRHPAAGRPAAIRLHPGLTRRSISAPTSPVGSRSMPMPSTLSGPAARRTPSAGGS